MKDEKHQELMQVLSDETEMLLSRFSDRLDEYERNLDKYERQLIEIDHLMKQTFDTINY